MTTHNKSYPRDGTVEERLDWLADHVGLLLHELARLERRMNRVDAISSPQTNKDWVPKVLG